MLIMSAPPVLCGPTLCISMYGHVPCDTTIIVPTKSEKVKSNRQVNTRKDIEKRIQRRNSACLLRGALELRVTPLGRHSTVDPIGRVAVVVAYVVSWTISYECEYAEMIGQTTCRSWWILPCMLCGRIARGAGPKPERMKQVWRETRWR